MVSAELTHNPYLLETTASFNGRRPMVNCAIEKIESLPLVDWVDEIPRIFRDEMNGYDFDLLFTGTDDDFKRVVDAFRNQGIAYDIVRVMRGGKLEEVTVKREKIRRLFEWLKENRNRRFDYDWFIAANAELLDDTVSYVIVHGDPTQVELPAVSVEGVESADELAGVRLTNIPILLTLSRRNRASFRAELIRLLQRPDVEGNQLFFYIHPAMDKDRAVRVISDLGVRDPQVVDSPDDERIVSFLNDYPTMTYVRKAVAALRGVLTSVEDTLAKVSRFSEETNAGAQHEISELEFQIDRLKRARGIVRDNDTNISYLADKQFAELFAALEDRIGSWRNWKTGVKGTEQIEKAALEYADELWRALREFEGQVQTQADFTRSSIDDAMSDLYESVGCAPRFTPVVADPAAPAIDRPNFADIFVHLTKTEYVGARNDLLGFFGSVVDSNVEKKPIEVASFEEWRAAAQASLMPLAKEYASAWKTQLSGYNDSMAKEYSEQYDRVIEAKNEAKERAASRLSDTERRFQEDSDWAEEFEDRLTEIERG